MREFDMGFYKLRPIDPKQDSPDYFQYIKHPEVEKFIPVGNIPQSEQESFDDLTYWSDLFLRKRGFYWAIATQDHNKMIGTIGYNSLSFFARKAEISYDLNYSYWRMGIMTRAIRHILDFSEHNIRLVRISASVALHNDRSIKLLQKHKFKQEGIMRCYENLHGKLIDAYLYSIIFRNNLTK